MSKKEIVIADVVKKYDNPIAELVQVACQFSSTLFLVNGTHRINAKSIMGMMSLGLAEGEQITIIANGPDEEEAVNAIDKYISKQQ